ncbi:molybdopterin molybdotransferase MoeA [Kocuria sp. JC486]|nr:molybdopterin molybdotransferase MoeA [Kocuria sp. JC486]
MPATGGDRPRTDHGHSHHAPPRSVEDHLRAVTELLGRSPWFGREPVRLPLEQAAGRVLAEDVEAGLDLPPFTNSQMDGYAVRSADTAVPSGLQNQHEQVDATAGNPGAADSTESLTSLRVGPTVPAGHAPDPIEAGQAVPVMTGATLPPGADCVVPVEDARPSGFHAQGATVSVPAGQAPGRFVRPAGDDVVRGTRVLRAGDRLTPLALGTCAALGLGDVLVRPPLRVGILTTGDEVVQPGTPRGPAQIFDSNATILRGVLADAGAEVVAVHHVPDDDDVLRALLAPEAAEAPHPDLWISSGGISEGAFEVVRRVLSGPDVAEFSEFLHVAMQPGGPQGLARVDGVPFVCFPGNPISTWVSWEMFLRPALTAVTGAPSTRTEVRVRSGDEFECLPGRARVVRAHWDGEVLTKVGGYGSHLLAAAVGVNALVILPPGRGTVPSGQDVVVRLLT